MSFFFFLLFLNTWLVSPKEVEATTFGWTTLLLLPKARAKLNEHGPAVFPKSLHCYSCENK